MAVEVDFITLGDASEKLDTPAPTLRHWTQQLEDYEIHYVKRNNRNERIYYDTDLEIFGYLRDLKAEHGRRTTTKDLAYMILDRGKKGEFQLRRKEDAPAPSQQSNKTSELLNQDDIKRLMDSERVKQFMGIVVEETTKQLKVEMVEELKEAFRDDVRTEVSEAQKQTSEEIRQLKEALRKQEEQSSKLLKELLEQKKEEEKQRIEEKQKVEEESRTIEKKGFFAKLFGG